MVPGDGVPAQRQAEVALLLEEEIDKRVMEAITKNEEAFARYIAFIFGRHLMHDPAFVDAVLGAIKRNQSKKE